MLALSLIAVLGVIAFLAASMFSPGLFFVADPMIHSGVPWLLITVLVIGIALAVAAVIRRPSFFASLLAGVELLIAGPIIYYFLAGSYLPSEHLLNLNVGNVFPAYELRDHKDHLRSNLPGTIGAPALYIFYRGDW